MKGMPKPADAHKKLEKLAGTWSGDEKMHPSPWDPQGGTAIGRVENRIGLGGFILVQDYEQTRHGQPIFQGHAVISWDEGRQAYVLHWWDSMGMPPNEFVGNFESNVLTMTSQSSQGNSRCIWDFSEEGKYNFKMDVSQDGEQWQTLMEGSYSKIGE